MDESLAVNLISKWNERAPVTTSPPPDAQATATSGRLRVTAAASVGKNEEEQARQARPAIDRAESDRRQATPFLKPTGYRVHSAKSLYHLPKAQRATPPDGFALIDLMPSRRARVMSRTDPDGLSRSVPRSDGLQIRGAAGKCERHAADRFVCDSSAVRALRHPRSPTSRSGYRPRLLFCIRCAGCLHLEG